MQQTGFRGLNNTTDALNLGLEWLTQADNVNVTDAAKLERRAGYSLAMAGSLSAGYATIDYSRLYVVDAGSLKAMTGPSSAVTLRAGLATAPMYWSEINGQVFYNNGVDRGIIEADNTLLPWEWPVPSAPQLLAVAGALPAGLYRVSCTFTLPDGRMTGDSDQSTIVLGEGQALQVSAIAQSPGCATNVWICPANSSVFGLAAVNPGAAMVWNSSPDSIGRDLTTAGMDPLPAGCDVVQAWRGRMYAAQYIPEQDASVLWVSQPLGFHLFDLEQFAAMVPGRILMLAPHDAGLVIGTERAIHGLTSDGIKQLAAYGVLPGAHWAHDDPAGDGAARLVFWTTRGVCAALPFTNLTERHVSVAAGISAGGTIVRTGGQKRYLVAIQQGGSAFNHT